MRLPLALLLALAGPLAAVTVEPNNLDRKVVLDFPEITKFQGQYDPKVGFMYRATHEGRMTVSIYVEPAREGVDDHAGVRAHYWPKAARNPEIDQETVGILPGDDRSVVRYVSKHRVDGENVWLHHFNVYAFVDGRMVDVHVSETTAVDAEPERLAAIIPTVAFVAPAP